MNHERTDPHDASNAMHPLRDDLLLSGGRYRCPLCERLVEEDSPGEAQAVLANRDASLRFWGRLCDTLGIEPYCTYDVAIQHIEALQRGYADGNLWRAIAMAAKPVLESVEGGDAVRWNATEGARSVLAMYPEDKR